MTVYANVQVLNAYLEVKYTDTPHKSFAGADKIVRRLSLKLTAKLKIDYQIDAFTRDDILIDVDFITPYGYDSVNVVNETIDNIYNPNPVSNTIIRNIEAETTILPDTFLTGISDELYARINSDIIYFESKDEFCYSYPCLDCPFEDYNNTWQYTNDFDIYIEVRSRNGNSESFTIPIRLEWLFIPLWDIWQGGSRDKYICSDLIREDYLYSDLPYIYCGDSMPNCIVITVKEEVGEPNLQVVYVSADKETINIGESVTITATIKNVGTARGTEYFDITINGTLQGAYKSITLDPNEEGTLSWTITFDEAGSYEVCVTPYYYF